MIPDPFLAWVEAENRELLAMTEVRYACSDCGGRRWRPALQVPPVCCGWEMTGTTVRDA